MTVVQLSVVSMDKAPVDPRRLHHDHAPEVLLFGYVHTRIYGVAKVEGYLPVCLTDFISRLMWRCMV